MEISAYDLELDVDFPKARVHGTVGIHVRKPDRPFVLDAAEMSVDAVSVDGAQASYVHDSKKGELAVRGVRAGSLVSIRFTKQVSEEGIFGLYKSKYEGGYLLVTDLEPAQARTVFPCKDHPAVKAVFNLTIRTQRGLRALSNSPLAAEKAEGKKSVFRFKPTPRMSTYLLFFGVGDFDTASVRFGGKDVLVAAKPGAAKKGRFVLDFAAQTLAYYQRYFGVAYPLEKLHLVALPEYHTGAMENWGAITSRAAYVLVGDDPSVSDKEGAATVIAHEIAHQWFGDLVTMKWWDDVWLNESFATFMECKAVQKLHPEWDPWAGFVRSQTFRSQATDALSTTHPIHLPVPTVADAQLAFDGISYGKGGSVLRMIESFVGEERFRKGVSAYLKRFSYSNAAGADLWKALEEASGLPVSRIMSRWVKTPGFPLVSVSYSGGKLRFSQSRFSLAGKRSETVWPVPLTFSVNGRRRSALMEGAELAVDAPGLKSLAVNLDHAGFYSVLYEGRLKGMLERDFPRLGPLEKAGLMNDMFLFLLAGRLEPAEYFRLVEACAREEHPLVVQTVADELLMLNAIAAESQAFARAAARFALAQQKRLGMARKSGEPPIESTVREVVLVLLARLDTPETAALAGMFRGYDTLDPNLKAAVGIAYARTRGREAYPRLLEMVKGAPSESERGRLYGALTSFKEPELVEKALELGISGEVSRSDSGHTIVRAGSNPRARQALWSWLTKRYDALYEIYAGSQQFFLYYEAVVPNCGVEDPEAVRQFFSGAKMKQGGIAFRRVIESVGVRSRLRKRLLEA